MTVSATDYTAVFGSVTDTAYASGFVSIPTTGSASFSATAGVSASGSCLRLRHRLPTTAYAFTPCLNDLHPDAAPFTCTPHPYRQR